MHNIKNLTFWVALLCCNPIQAIAEVANRNGTPHGSIEATWAQQKNWANHDADQHWISSTNWETDTEALLNVLYQGLGLTLQLSPNETQLSELYYDTSTKFIDYSVGLKDQEWAFAYYNPQINWLDGQHYALAEHYFTFGSGQVFCRTKNELDALCGARLSGWIDRLDWQVMAGYNRNWQGAGALQFQFGRGGLAYVETYIKQNAPTLALIELAPDIYQTTLNTQAFNQTNLGLQWTTAFNLTLLGEWIYQPTAFSKHDWVAITKQLKTNAAGNVINAFQTPLSQHSFLLREYWEVNKLTIENITLYSPQAQNSVFNTLTLEYKLNPVLATNLEWGHEMNGSVLNRIGKGNTVTIGFTYKNGW